MERKIYTGITEDVLKRLLVIIIFLTPVGLSAQSRKELEERKNHTQKEIEYSNRLLLETRENRKSTLQRVRILNKRIQLRNDIIKNINGEIVLVDNEIEQKDVLIADMEKDLNLIREQYAKTIVQAYWNKNRRNWMMYILSSESFNQAYRRMKYLQQFSKYRREQAELISRMQDDIVAQISALEEIKIQKNALLLEKQNENHSLQRERSGKSKIVAELNQREKELKAEIEKKKTIASKLEKEIAAIIAEEARKARSRNMYDQLTPEEKLISDNFQGNKGKLPWPVERGIITGKYGVHPHPVLKQVTVDNDGVDISTVKGASARALFDGEVTKIVSILGANYAVILRHGNFLSVYQNIVDLKVKQGEKVKIKQVLGTVHTDSETNSTIIHVQIWKERTIQNPEDWLSRN
jgi:septal ring factor EnvC (AmiA/AmiB activator)